MVPTVGNQKAVDVATLAQRVVSQYFSHFAAMHVARDPRAAMLGPQIEPEQIVPVLKIPRRDGNAMIISFDHYFAEGRKPESRQDFDRVCLMGALLMVGDALVSQVVQNDVFKSAPLPSWVGRSGPDGPVKIDDAEH